MALATTAPGQQPANGIAARIARAKLAMGFLLKFVLVNQFSATLATTAPGQQPANGIASRIASAKLANGFLIEIRTRKSIFSGPGDHGSRKATCDHFRNARI